MKAVRKRLRIVVTIVTVLACGAHASLSTAVAAGTDLTDVSLAATEGGGTMGAEPSLVAAAVVGFLVGYIVADLVNHFFGNDEGQGAPVQVDEQVFDF